MKASVGVTSSVVVVAACGGPPASDDAAAGAGDVGLSSDVTAAADSEAATDGEDPDSDEVPDDLETAADRYAVAFCNWARGCGEDFVWEFAYGDHDQCVALLTSDDWYSFDGSTTTVADFDACGDALGDAGCETLPPECTFYGARLAGEPCVVGMQCASSYCHFDDREALCGTCEDVTVEGDDCLVQQTPGEPREFCVGTVRCGTDGTCWEPVSPGGLCDPEPCTPSGDCIDGTCVERGSLGDPCDRRDDTIPGCDFGAGLWCDDTAGQCVEIDLADVGESCQSGAGLTLCSGPAACVPDADGALVCTPRAAAGDPCEDRQDCAGSLRCDGGTCTELTCGP